VNSMDGLLLLVVVVAPLVDGGKSRMGIKMAAFRWRFLLFVECGGVTMRVS